MPAPGDHANQAGAAQCTAIPVGQAIRMNPLVIAIHGCTGVGKTDFSIGCALQFNGEVVNADSRYLYRGLDIGVAKPTREQQQRVRHHLIDVLDPGERAFIPLIQRMAYQSFDDIITRRAMPILVGGTPLYMNAITQGWSVPEVEPNPELRSNLERRAETEGIGVLQEELAAVDPVAAERSGVNLRRIIRALEIHNATGRPMSEIETRFDPPYRFLNIGLQRNRDLLRTALGARVDRQIEDGLVDEVRALLDHGLTGEEPAFSAIGYRQLLPYLRGETTLEKRPWRRLNRIPIDMCAISRPGYGSAMTSHGSTLMIRGGRIGRWHWSADKRMPPGSPESDFVVISIGPYLLRVSLICSHGERRGAPPPMQLLIVDATPSIEAVLGPVCAERNWSIHRVATTSEINAAMVDVAPDVILVHGDGAGGEAAHICQRLKQNVLTAGIPILLFEDAPPPAWMLAGLPADAILQAPWDIEEFTHQADVLLPSQEGTKTLDDLTNFPRREGIIDEMQRRIVSRELFGVGILNLREADAYRQDFGRSGLDQFVVLVSVLLRRHAAGSVPISVGHLDDGNFIVLGPSTTIQEVVAQTTYEFDSLVPAYYEMDTLFGADDAHDVGPSTWIALQGAVCLVEPDGFENIWQIGCKLADTLTQGAEALQLASAEPVADESEASYSRSR